ncbi:hypothetical protein CHLRE_15g635717v5 [Chlamydomonas reinhardtii]|uniref:Type II toxin-antitoxin system HicB family antitoxin n=1 Tax=Chlamydomonas reinhardtii TaxID=3055 RepID=A0A2K3CWE9_CHLRE|nr:uncharacterized protein CHLRE_15g635717v5 [Chlamydomonas reinhardtii]XP_042916383.1 uncharacterized protein CHLRE_15g635717v5 [Chlamydomonas reinhardtii]PNW72612.1 hypothetical protein CHLRE_15g635717v5 [Chlamydomonas reinhardtii]PNW72613.1 hypothetical protein CHLRE_15g635717v5 [Chlamydomonas reinhardtii]
MSAEMKPVFSVVLWCFGDGWYEAWVPDVVGAMVIASSEDQAMAEIREQLAGCLDGGDLPTLSNSHVAGEKADALLRECAQGDYPTPLSRRVVSLTL